jgi:hypothetical protein
VINDGTVYPKGGCHFEVGVLICTIICWAWEDFWFSFSNFAKIGKAKTHLAHALLIFKNKKLCLGIKKKGFSSFP